MKLLKMMLCLGIGGLLMLHSPAAAYPIRTPEGNMPMVHVAVLESTPGDMQKMGAIGAKTVAPQTAKEAGTYALYGGIDAKNPDIMRLFEIYESYEAYRIHSTSEAFQEYRARRLPMLKSLKLIEVNGIVLEQKSGGVAKMVVMRGQTVAKDKVADFQLLVKTEAVRAVNNNARVMGMFIAAEHDNPNVFHIMELYRDKKAYEEYISSKEYRELQEKIAPFFISSRTIEGLPTNIPLSNKGLFMKK